MSIVGPLITEENIKNLVYTFYGKVRKDEVLGPIFESKITGDWDEHLSKMCDFWSSIALSTGRYKGRPVAKHLAIPDLNPEHFARWIALFEEASRELFYVKQSEFFIEKARKIAESLMQAIAFHHGALEL